LRRSKRQGDALDAFVIDGIRHNIPFPLGLDGASALEVGRFVDRLHRRGIPGRLSPDRAGRRACAGFGLGRGVDRSCARRAQAQHLRSIDRTQRHPRQQRAVWLGDKEYRLEVKRENGTLAVRFPDEAKPRHLGSDWAPGEPLWSGTIDSKPVGGAGAQSAERPLRCRIRASRTKAYVYTQSEAAYARLMPVKVKADTGKFVLCPMPGLVVSVAVKEGQEVKAGETVAVVEAMKMENVLRAEVDGTVKKINAKPGDSLAVDAVILEFA
jgi:propionyl-CoA carboxylase alpha chain